jgi:hypothetical protein
VAEVTTLIEESKTFTKAFINGHAGSAFGFFPDGVIHGWNDTIAA